MNKIKKALDEGGIPLLVERAVKKHVAPHFSAEFIYNTVTVKKSMDKAGDRPDYEKGLCTQIRTHVSRDDKVTIIGGGHGVSGIVAKRQTGDEGTVRVFEPSAKMLRHIRWVSENNDVSIDSIRPQAVGEVENMWGDNQYITLETENLNPCDVLVIDSEGTEIDIIADMDIKPETIIVESHPMHNSPTEEVIDILELKGYKILDVRAAEVGEYAKAGLEIITAKRK